MYLLSQLFANNDGKWLKADIWWSRVIFHVDFKKRTTFYFPRFFGFQKVKIGIRIPIFTFWNPKNHGK
jgi:hypothetical protein